MLGRVCCCVSAPDVRIEEVFGKGLKALHSPSNNSNAHGCLCNLRRVSGWLWQASCQPKTSCKSCDACPPGLQGPGMICLWRKGLLGSAGHRRGVISNGRP